MRKFINSGLAALTLLISSSAFALTLDWRKPAG